MGSPQLFATARRLLQCYSVFTAGQPVVGSASHCQRALRCRLVYRTIPLAFSLPDNITHSVYLKIQFGFSDNSTQSACWTMSFGLMDNAIQSVYRTMPFGLTNNTVQSIRQCQSVLGTIQFNRWRKTNQPVERGFNRISLTLDPYLMNNKIHRTCADNIECLWFRCLFAL